MVKRNQSERERINAELERLWEEAKQWEADGFPGGPIVAELRNYELTADPMRLIDGSGEKERGVQFRVRWRGKDGDQYVDLMVGIRPDPDSRLGPCSGVRLLPDSAADLADGDICWHSCVELRSVLQVHQRVLPTRDRTGLPHKNENKFFRYKRPMANAAGGTLKVSDGKATGVRHRISPLIG